MLRSFIVFIKVPCPSLLRVVSSDTFSAWFPLCILLSSSFPLLQYLVKCLDDLQSLGCFCHPLWQLAIPGVPIAFKWWMITPSARMHFLLKVCLAFFYLIQIWKLKYEATNISKIYPFLNEIISAFLHRDSSFMIWTHKVWMLLWISDFSPNFAHNSLTITNLLSPNSKFRNLPSYFRLSSLSLPVYQNMECL